MYATHRLPTHKLKLKQAKRLNVTTTTGSRDCGYGVSMSERGYPDQLYGGTGEYYLYQRSRGATDPPELVTPAGTGGSGADKTKKKRCNYEVS